jgi:hypothetical protein
MAKMMKAKGKGGSQPPRAATIMKTAKPKSGKPVKTHPISYSMPPKSGLKVAGGNPNKATRGRMDKLAMVAHAHTKVLAPVKAYPINKASKVGKNKVTLDPKLGK